VYTILWYFLIYSFLGWCVEVVFVSLEEGHFVNRGFLNGPLCPIYGFGVLAIVHMLTNFEDNILVLFILSTVITSTLEFITGWLLEKIFATKWWDYSENKFNLMGYICLRFSLMWGTACVFVMRMVQPIVISVVEIFSHSLGVLLLVFFIIIIIIDVVVTIRIMTKFNRHLQEITHVANRIRDVSNSIGARIADGALLAFDEGSYVFHSMQKYTERLEHLKEQVLKSQFFGGARLLRAFPKMKSAKYQNTIKELRDELQRKIFDFNRRK